MTTRPEPPIAADTDIRDLDGFMLNTERLMASELWALSTGDEFKAALGLWCRAWKQQPPGSLPDDDRVLAAFSGAGPRWKKVKAVALRGFVKCSDGRLYHEVLCEDVLRAAKKKAERHERTKAATEARKKQRDGQRDVDRDDVRRGQRNEVPGTGQGQGQGSITVPDGTVTARDACMRRGVELIAEQCKLGTIHAQQFVAGLCKLHGDDAVELALTELFEHPKVEPRSWLKAALQGGVNGNHGGRSDTRSAAGRIRAANPHAPDPEADRYL